jgi:hypothetical protein
MKTRGQLHASADLPMSNLKHNTVFSRISNWALNECKVHMSTSKWRGLGFDHHDICLSFLQTLQATTVFKKNNKTQQLHTAPPFSDVNDRSDGTMTHSLLWNSKVYCVFPTACPGLMNVINIHISGFFNISFNIILLFCRGRGGLKTLRKEGYSCRLFQ